MSAPNHGHGRTPPGSNESEASAGASDFEKRRRAFEREPTNIQLLTSPGMTFGMSSSSQRGPGQEQPRRSQRVEEMSVMRDQFSQQQDELTQLSAECSALRAMVEERYFY